MFLSVILINDSNKTLKNVHHHKTKASYLLQGPQGIKGAKGSSVSITIRVLVPQYESDYS